MIKILFGLLIFLIPFLLVNKFKYKRLGFFYILSFVLSFHFILSVILQAFGIFKYWIVIGVNLIIGIVVLARVDYNELFGNLKKIKIDWMLIFIIFILLVQFCSIHYNYTGVITRFSESGGRVGQGYEDVQNFKYAYPYFSDEWSAVSLIKYSITFGKLPLVNPLWYNSGFPNLELGFHSFVSGIMMVFGLDALTQYNLVAIFFSLIICLLVYFILRFNKIGKFASGVACLSISYIVSGANLPGIWNLIPLNLGMIFMLLGFLFMSVNDGKMILFLSFFVLIFYPPLFVLYGVSLLMYFTFARIDVKKKIKYFWGFLLICFFSVLVLSLFAFFVWSSFSEFATYIFSKLFYETFTKNSIPNFSILIIIPFFSLVFSIIGLYKWKKKIWLIVPIIVGLIYWFFYSNNLWRFIIEYERVVFATSVLIVLLSGFGLQYFINYLKKKNFVRKYKILEILGFLILIWFLVFSFYYTERDVWAELKLYSVNGGKTYSPASPANQYLHEDDLRLFKGIEGKRVLTIPWKGIVIGVATDNYPLETKPATITNKFFRYNEFMSVDCDRKREIAKEKEIDYVYSEKFECGGFEFIGKSEEGLYLYELS